MEELSTTLWCPWGRRQAALYLALFRELPDQRLLQQQQLERWQFQ
jgi:hypothetical protein